MNVMHCNPLIEPACKAVSHVVNSASRDTAVGVLGGIAQAINTGIRWVVVNTATWWIHLPSPDLAAEPAVTRIQQWLLPITAAVAVGAVIAAGTRMALSRRANPLLDVTGGLLTIAAASTIGVTIATLLLKAGDVWAAWVLQAATGGHFVQRLELALDLGGAAAPAVVLVFGLLAIILSLVQAVLMLFRQAALIILAGMLPLAAAGSIAPLTRAWVRKVTAWMLALICYKPAAAAVYAAAFTMIGEGGGARTALMGFVMLVLSVLTLPALMRFFTWATGTIGAPNIGAGQLLGAATMGAVAVGAMRGGGGGASDQAAYIDSHLNPPSAPGSGGDAPPNSPPPAPDGSGGSGPHSDGPSSSGGTGAPSSRPRWPYAPAQSNSPPSSTDHGEATAPAGAATQTSPPTAAGGSSTAHRTPDASGAAPRTPSGAAPAAAVTADGTPPAADGADQSAGTPGAGGEQ
jgi:hypothetical protein